MPRWLGRTSRWKTFAFLALAFAGALIVFSLRSLRQAAVALRESSSAVSRAGDLAVEIAALPEQAHSLFDYSYATTGFHSICSFDGDLFVAARSSLTRYSSDGRVKRVWRVGRDLPPFPLTALAVRRGIGTPELWAATDGGGVLIFNGRNLETFLPADAALRKFNALLPLGDGRVILGSANGVYETDGKHLRLFHPQFAHLAVTSLAGGEDELWLGTLSDGVWLWRGGEALHFLAELPDPQVLSIHASSHAPADTASVGTTWVGTPVGISEFSHGQFRRRLGEGVFAQSLLERNGTLWIGTADEGVIPIELQAASSHHAFSSSAETPASNAADVVSFAQIGNDLLAVSASSITRVPSGENILSSDPQTLADGHITALEPDSRGRLWIGYFDRGLDIARSAAIQPVEHLETDLLFCINRIKEDEVSRNIAVATANGLAIFDASGRIRQTLNRRSGLLADHVTDFIYGPGNERYSSLFIATPAGISFVEDGNISGVSGFQGLVNNHVYTLAAWNGFLLAGTLGGFSLLHNGQIQASYTTANASLRQNWITASATSGQDLYLGTYGSGVVRVDVHHTIKTFSEFSAARVEINSNSLLATRHAVYAGTAGHGLAILPAGEERWRWVRNGLPSSNVTALAWRDNTLFIGTDNGLVSAPERALLP